MVLARRCENSRQENGYDSFCHNLFHNCIYVFLHFYDILLGIHEDMQSLLSELLSEIICDQGHIVMDLCNCGFYGNHSRAV
jgi:hypothetical protein